MTLIADYPVERIRADFPMLRQRMNGRPLVYLDSAATSLKPRSVIDRLVRFYAEEYGTVRRGAYALSQQATALYEAVREQARGFLNAEDSDEIVFVRGVTEAINLVSTSYGLGRFGPGDEILITAMEHHSNIVPWQIACARTGATLKVAPIDDDGCLVVEEFAALLSERTRLVSIVHVSNGLGTVNPVAELCAMAHDAGALAMVDGAQSTPHMPVDVRAIGCDFFACSGHKMLGPTGVGLFYGRRELLAEMEPYQGGGEMIDQVTFAGSTWDDPPHRFEAGTPAFAQVIGLGEAMSYLDGVGRERIAAWGDDLLSYATERILDVPEIRIMGTAPEKSGVLAFTMGEIHPLDIGTILDQEGIAIRVGQHCVQPVMDRFGVHSTARASFYLYNTRQEVDAFIEGLGVVRELMS